MGTIKRCLLLAGLLTVGLTQIAPAAHAATTAGVRDFAYSGSAPTGQKPQSKLWYNDGAWWGILWSKAQSGFTIQKFNWATDKWTDTGSATKLDTRNRGQADVTWTGSKLYVTSNIDPTVTNTTDKATKLWRLSYNATSKTYTKDSGFPVTLVSSAVESVTFDRAYDGKLWFTYTLDQAGGNRKLFVRHTTTSDTAWGAAFTPAVTGASNLSADDISSLVAYKGTDGVGKIGVMWSNQTDGTMYYISHVDGQADTAWTQDPAVTGASMADDHLALRSLNGDANGNVVAVMKTSLNDVLPATSTEPLIQVGVLQPDGTWKKAVFSRVVDNHTRAIVEIDRTNRQLYVFASAPCCSGGAVYMKKTSLDNPDFSTQTGMGTPFMQNATDVNINNPTSTKQELNSTTGVLVEASDDHTKFYLHNKITLPSGPVAPAPPAISSPANNSYDTDGNVTVSGTAVAGATVELFDGAVSKGTTTANASTGAFNFALTAVADGAHTYTAKATNSGGTSTASNGVTVNVDTQAPAAPAISSPTDPAADTTGSVTFSGTAEAGSSVQLFEGATAVGTPVTATGGNWSKTITGIAIGPHTYTAKATDAASNASGASNSVTVTESTPADNTPPTVAGRVPAPNATGVANNAQVKVTFSEAMDSSTITTSTITLKQGSTGVAGSVTYDAATRTATFTPASALADGTSYTVTVVGGSGGVKDAGSNAMTADDSWSFNTATGTTTNTLFSDDFEGGNLSKWSVTLGADGTAVDQQATVKSGAWAAKLTTTTLAGSVAYIRKTLATAQTDFTTGGDFNIASGGSSGNVPILRFFAGSTRLLTLYRQNGTSGNNLFVFDGTNRIAASAALAFGTWAHFDIHVIATGSGTSTVQVTMNGAPIFSSSAMILPATGITAIQVGNETSAQPGVVFADNIVAQS